MKIINAVFGLGEVKIIGKGNYGWLSLREAGINGEKAIYIYIYFFFFEKREKAI